MKYYENVGFLDSVSNQFVADKKDKVMRLISSERALYNYFFQKVSGLSWFNELNEFLEVNENNMGFGTNDFWQPLNYLEKIAEQVKKGPKANKRYGIELLKIVNNIVKFSAKKEDPINNYHIWWFLVKILHKIPNDIIKNAEIEFTGSSKEKGVSIEQFQKWLQEFTNSSMQGDLAVEDVLRLLLPKFLNEDMKGYAGEIVKIVTRIRPSKKKPVFVRQENAEIVWSGYWLREVFSKYGKVVGEICGVSVIEILLDTLCKAFEYHTKEQFRVFKVNDTEYYRVTLNRVGLEGIEKQKIAYKKGSFSGIAQEYTTEQLKNMNPDNGYDIYHTAPEGDKHHFKMKDAKDLKSFKNIFNKIFEEGDLKSLELDKADEFDKNVCFFYESFFEDYSRIWHPSLEKPEECHGDGAHEMLSIILKDVFLGKSAVSIKDGNCLINKIIYTERYKFPMFGRMVLLVLDKQWDQYGDLLGDVLKNYPKLLEQSDYAVELFNLFKSHAKDFNPEIVCELKKRIDNPPEWYKKRSEEKQDDTSYLRWQYKRMAILKDIEPFKSDYLKLKDKFKDDTEPSVEQTSTWNHVTHSSPISKEQISQQSVADTVKCLKEFEGAKNTWEIMDGKPDKSGLADALYRAVKENPKYFVKDIILFADVSLRYAALLLRGLQDAWQDNKLFDWEEALLFCKKYIQNHKNAKEEKSDDFDFGRTCQTIAEEAARLIEVGSTNDQYAFDDSLINSANELFEMIFSTFPFTKKDRQNDGRAMNYALNSFPGRIIYSYFIFSLHIKRVCSSHDLVKNWGEKRFNRFFEGVDEGYIYFGRFLPNMCFLDKDWAHNKVREINGYSLEDKHWKDFFEGYLSGTSLYKDLYKLLRLSYKKAIENKVLSEEIDRKLVQHITLGYLRDYESLEGNDSLFALMLKDTSTEEKKHRWKVVVNFMWSCRDRHTKKNGYKEMSKDVKNKILDFWDWTYKEKAVLKENLGVEEYGDLQSLLAKLTFVLDKVKDGEKYKSKSWLLECAPYVNRDFNSGFFIEYLSKFEDVDSLRNIIEVYKKVLSSGVTPTYKKENIEILLDRIYKIDPASAEGIIETYGRRGQHFLRDVWERNNKSKS